MEERRSRELLEQIGAKCHKCGARLTPHVELASLCGTIPLQPGKLAECPTGLLLLLAPAPDLGGTQLPAECAEIYERLAGELVPVAKVLKGKPTQTNETRGGILHWGRETEHAAGLQCFVAEPAEIVATYVLMPLMHGLEVIAMLRRWNSRVPILAISGGVSVHGLDVLHMAQDHGADRTLAKPFAIDELTLVLHSLLVVEGGDPLAAYRDLEQQQFYA